MANESKRPPRGGPHDLAEYSATQESAQHHDSLIWTATGPVWGGNFVLLGFIIEALSSGCGGVWIPLAGLLGFILTAGVWKCVAVWNEIMNIKYRRCRELEERLDMWQHRDVEKTYEHGEMKWWYS